MEGKVVAAGWWGVALAVMPGQLPAIYPAHGDATPYVSMAPHSSRVCSQSVAFMTVTVWCGR